MICPASTGALAGRRWPRRAALCGALALCALLIGCGGPPVKVTPPPPPLDLSPALPIDAPLTAIVRPDALPARLPIEVMGGAGAGQVITEALGWLSTDRLARLGLDPAGPLWLSARAGPVLAALRSAEDTARLITERGHHPRMPSIDGVAGGVGDPDGLAPAWVHLRLVGPTGPAPAAGFSAALGALFGGVLAADLDAPPETLAAALDTTPSLARAAVEALDAPGLRLFRLLDAAPPMLVAIRRVEGHATVDVIWDWDLGPGALAGALAALPERRAPDPGRVPVPPAHRIAAPLAPEEIVRVRLDHASWQQAGWMLGEVAALQSVLSQGRLRGDPATALGEARARARLPVDVLGPLGAAFRASALSITRDARRWRARLTADYAARAGRLAGLRDGLAPTAHGPAQDAAPVVITLAAQPDLWRPTVARLLPDPLGPLALGPTLDRCGPACLPAAWLTPVGWLADPPGVAAALAGMTPLSTALADATGAHLALDGRGFAAMVGHPAPGTLARAAWAPLLADTGLEHRWIVGDRLASLVMGDAPALRTALAGAHRGAPVVTAPVLQATLRDLPPAWGVSRLDLSVTFERAAMAIDAAFEASAAPPSASSSAPPSASSSAPPPAP